MKTKILLLLLFLGINVTLFAQNDTPKKVRLGMFFTLDNNLSSNDFYSKNVADLYTGYIADYDKTNYRIGLTVEYMIKNRFSLNSGVNYSNKDFTGSFFSNELFLIIVPVPPPETIKLQFIEIPLSLKYYFLNNKLKIFGDVGINNQFVLTKKTINNHIEEISGSYTVGVVVDNSFILGLKLGAGIEYDFNHNIGMQLFTEYNKGITNLISESGFKVDYLSFGVGILKSF